MAWYSALYNADRLAICDRCGFKFYLSDLKKTWDGHMVCDKDWEGEHPQNKLKVRPEIARRVDGRPEKTDVFLSADLTAEDIRNGS